MGLSKRERGELYLAGLLHDIGKIRIKDKDLDLTAPYFEDEGPEMRRHVQIGANCLCSVKELSYILPGIVHHHELWSGNGYPEGRKEKEAHVG